MSELRIVRVVDANNPDIGDIYLDAAGNTEIIDGAEAIAQRIWVRLQFFLGEWVHDLRQGMPYRERFFEKGASPEGRRAVISEVISTTPGVATLVSLSLQEDSATRELTVAFTARTVDGALVRSDDHGPFIIGAAA